MAIPQLGAFPAPPLLGQDQTTFNTNASATLSYMFTWATEMNAVSSAIDSASTTINSQTLQTQTNTNTVVSKTAIAEAAAATATSAKDAIEAYVIPTEATYNPQLIDSKINALMPYSGYTQVSKKLDNFVFKTDANFTYRVADKNRYVKFGDTIVDTYGEELVTNGDLYIHSNSDVTAIDGTVTVENITTYKAWVSENYPTTIGKNYLINVGHVDGTFRIFIGNSNGSGDILVGEYGVYELIFKATSPTTYLTIENISSTTGVSFSYLDNISVREIQTADFSNDIPDVVEVITDGSNTTSVSVNAGDYVVDGSELVTNGTFDTDTSGWDSSGSLVAVNGYAQLSISSQYQNMSQNTFSLEDGKEYILSFSIITNNISVYIGFGSSAAYPRVVSPTVLSTGSYTYKFTANSSNSGTTFLQFISSSSSGIFEIDNISVRRVSDTFRAIQTAPIGTALTNTTYFEDRTQIGVTNQVLSYHAYNTLTKAYEGIKTEVLFSDVSKEDLLNNDIWMSANGFSKVSKHLYSKGVYYVLPVEVRQMSNNGVFHEFLNVKGSYNHTGGAIALTHVNSLADCFLPANIGTTIKQPQGKDPRFMYADDGIDVRQYAKIATPYEIELIRKDKEENGIYQYFNSLNSNTHLDIEFLGSSTYYPAILSDIIASGITPKITFNTVDDNGVSNAFDGVKTSFKLLSKMTNNHQVLKSTDSGATWSVQTVTTSYITNTITFSVAPLATDIVIVSATANNDAYVETAPKPVVEVEPKVIATNSHSLYKGALVGNQVAGKIQVGNGANGYESKVLENILLDENLDIHTTPQHSAIALDNSTSSASKYFNTLAEDTDNTYAQLFGEEITYDSVSEWGDTDFSQLTNGTLPDINGGNDVRTFCGLIPLNIGVK